MPIAITSSLDSDEVPPLPQGPANPIVTTVPLDQRTLANSNYKRFYNGALPSAFQHELLGAVHNMLKIYAARINPTVDPHALATGVHEFMEKIQDEAFRNNEALQKDVDAVAEYLWTSGKTHAAVNNQELCSVLNAVIRDDLADEVQAAAMIFRSINSRRVNRDSGGARLDVQSYPANGETWRGGGFRRQHRAFFRKIKGKKYRVPGFLATSDSRTVASGFAFKADKTHPCAMWRILFDKRGKDHPEHRVQHMTFVSKTLIKGENEYLFAPYSVFTLSSIQWSDDVRKPHEFTVRAARDNKNEDENLPLAPWY